jgi:hypothetical protein
MSKKSRRTRTKFQAFAGKQGQMQAKPHEAKEGMGVAASDRIIRAAVMPRNYEYLVPDLRTVGIITLALFVVLAILTIVIQQS